MIYKDYYTALLKVKEKFPNAKSVVAAWDIAYNIYEDDSYNKQVATLYYAENYGSLFGYDYRLVFSPSNLWNSLLKLN